MKARHKRTLAEAKEARRLYEDERLSGRAVGKIMGASSSTIERLVVLAGGQMRGKNELRCNGSPPWTQEEAQQARALYEEPPQMTLAQIGQQLGRKGATVGRMIRAAGGQIRRRRHRQFRPIDEPLSEAQKQAAAQRFNEGDGFRSISLRLGITELDGINAVMEMNHLTRCPVKGCGALMPEGATMCKGCIHDRALLAQERGTAIRRIEQCSY